VPHTEVDGFNSLLLLERLCLQVKCCGDTSVRHTEVGGFNSPLLLRSKFSSRLKLILEIRECIATRGDSLTPRA
jgi:hypothetical protein